jgi:integrase
VPCLDESVLAVTCGIIGRRNCGAPCGRQSVAATLRSATYSTFFGLIAATALRISEALHLQCADVDLANGTLTVRKTKFSKSRLPHVSPKRLFGPT